MGITDFIKRLIPHRRKSLFLSLSSVSKTLSLSLSLFLSLSSVFVKAQSFQSADCMLALLGKPLGSDSVQEALAQMGIIYKKEFAYHTTLSMPKEGVLLKTSGGLLSEIVLFNDSVPYQGQIYRRFRGAVPFGLSWADTIGLEENTLFQQNGVTYGFDPDDVSYASILTQSGATTYYLQEGYLSGRSYYFYHKAHPHVKLHRNLYYRFVWAPRPHGPYLKLPPICGKYNGGPFSTGVFASRADSGYFLGLHVGYRGIAQGSGIRKALDDGFMLGLDLQFPVNSRVSPPLFHMAGIDFASFNYRDSTNLLRTDQNTIPAHTQISLYYGLSYMPVIKSAPDFRPIAQLVGGPQWDYSPSLTFYSNAATVKSSSSTWFYQLGLGAGYRVSRATYIQLVAHYRAAKFVRYLSYNNVGLYDSNSKLYAPYDDLKGTKLSTVSIELCFRFNILGT